MLDLKFFLKVGPRVRDRYREHIFDKALDVNGKKFKGYKEPYGSMKRGNKFKLQSSKYANSTAPVLTESLLDALRQRTGTKVLGFYISSGKKIDRYTLDHYFPDYAYEKGQKVYDRKKVMAEYRKNKCLIVKDNIGYDEFYLLAGGEMQISDGQMATPSENAKKSELKRLFTSTLKSSRDSRIVLNKFIVQVA